MNGLNHEYDNTQYNQFMRASPILPGEEEPKPNEVPSPPNEKEPIPNEIPVSPDEEEPIGSGVRW